MSGVRCMHIHITTLTDSLSSPHCLNQQCLYHIIAFSLHCGVHIPEHYSACSAILPYVRILLFSMLVCVECFCLSNICERHLLLDSLFIVKLDGLFAVNILQAGICKLLS